MPRDDFYDLSILIIALINVQTKKTYLTLIVDLDAILNPTE